MVAVEHKPDAAPERAERPARGWRWLVAPLAIYAGTRMIQFALIAWMIPADSTETVRSRLLAWDAGWFMRIAGSEGYPRGYTYDESGELTANGLAFFPGYPMLVRAVDRLTWLDLGSAALLVAMLAGAAAAVGVYVLGERLYDARVGTVLAILFCAQPMSVVLSMGYSEGLFVALVAGALIAAHRRAWLVAGGVGLAAALTRPTGAAVAVALAVAAGMRLRRAEPGERVRAVVGATVALLGVPGYLWWVGQRVGDWRAWFEIQTAGWGTTFDFGSAALTFVTDSLRAGEGWVQVSIAMMLIAVVVAAVVALTRQVWPPLAVYGLIVLTLVLGQGGYYHSKPRLLVPVLLILVPAAVALGRARVRTAAAVLTGYALFGMWYGAYLLTVWRYAI